MSHSQLNPVRQDRAEEFKGQVSWTVFLDGWPDRSPNELHGTRDPETNSEFAPEKEWLEYDRGTLLGRFGHIFRGELLVLGSVTVTIVIV